MLTYICIFKNFALMLLLLVVLNDSKKLIKNKNMQCNVFIEIRYIQECDAWEIYILALLVNYTTKYGDSSRLTLIANSSFVLNLSQMHKEHTVPIQL